jgi:hypothetical protein
MNRCKITEQSQKPASWLNPRRRLNVERLIQFLKWNGTKVFFDDSRYDQFRDDYRVDRYVIDQAIDDAYALGLCEIRMVGNIPIVHLLGDDIDSTPAVEPRFVLVTGGGR